MMRGSSKQILNGILAELSTNLVESSELENATIRMRAGLLSRASTADETVNLIGKLEWGSFVGDDDQVEVQGISTIDSDVLITEFFEALAEIPGVKEKMLSIFPGMDSDEFEASVTAIWAIVSSAQMYASMLPVEAEGDLGLDEWVDSYTKFTSRRLKKQKKTKRTSINLL